ncbi:hypothetical protein HDU91_001820, partial [Kappamyces sp. JEL0680]
MSHQRTIIRNIELVCFVLLGLVYFTGTLIVQTYHDSFKQAVNVSSIRYHSSLETATVSPRAALGNQKHQLCAVVRTYPKTYEDIPALVLSLAQNRLKPLVYLVVTDRSGLAESQEVAANVNNFLHLPM